ncbi:MAG: ATP-binding protein [Gammaproteobacteria bacterium]|nr:ATP-binding protein [Gammaproteobacteria bacterium]
MRATQHIFRVRRQYNQWVANQTLEDYALRFTAKKARRWTAGQVSMTALGATAFLALEVIGGAITLNYGFTNAVAAMLTVGLVIFVTGFPISYFAAKHGLDIDLLTRGAGFGYLGSTITSLIYASFTFIFFAIEAAIMAMALKALFGIPVVIGYVLCALAVVPIVTHGITFISKFQLGTQPVWAVLQCLALFAVVYFEISSVEDWTQYQGLQAGPAPGFDLVLFGAASAVVFALVAQIGEQVDYLRFLPPASSISKLRWWTALIAAGPGWILIGIVKMLMGSFLAWLAFTRGMSMELATDPTHMYQTAFSYITHSPTVSLALAGLMVIISQMKINVTNAYAGSIAWSNFFSRLTHSHPGRVVWLVFNVVIALLLMELGIYQVLENILGVFAIIAVSWLGTIFADLTINKALKLSPAKLEFKRAHLYDINPVGLGSMLTAAVTGLCAYLGWFGETLQALAHFLTLATTLVMAPLIAYQTRGRYYIARKPSLPEGPDLAHECCICENTFEHEDMSYCPAYQGAICSLCCSLDGRCLDSCKPDARISRQLTHWIGKFMPQPVVALIDSRLGHYLAILGIISLINAALLTLVYYHVSIQSEQIAALIGNTLWTVFFIFMIISGVLAWLFLLTQESRVVAQEESNRQNQLLMAEIEAHQETDRELQEAKELAEAANLAKSRYLSGISHELRTPLQSILGYAQLLSRDKNIPKESRESINILRRSGEYLADLIEGLLDISKIEAGRLDIRREQVDLHTLLTELVDMFRLQAEAKSVTFQYDCVSQLPRYINSDEKRLRQILINLLSNAVKFTHSGEVSFSVRYRSHVAEFTVTDTGVGIAEDDLARIFNPFERVRKPGVPHVPGTGLGLTIVKLLAEVMGGDIAVTSELGKGSRFTLLMMLSRIDTPHLAMPPQTSITGYDGPRRTLLVVDDEPYHRGLITDLFSPLGFEVLEAQDADGCLEVIADCSPDLFLIDVSLPGIDGLELAKTLRSKGVGSPIMMISADAHERHDNFEQGSYHNDFMVKPIKLASLQEKIAKLLKLEWHYENSAVTASDRGVNLPQNPVIPEHPGFVKLRAYAEIGYLKGVKGQLTELEASGVADVELLDYLNHLAREARLEKMVELLEKNH